MWRPGISGFLCERGNRRYPTDRDHQRQRPVKNAPSRGATSAPGYALRRRSPSRSSSWLTARSHPDRRAAEDAHDIVLEDYIATVDAAKERRDRLTVQIEKRLADWTLAPVVEALQALRGMAMVAAATIVAELGDISRFSKAEQLMSYLGLVPSEDSSGRRRRQGGITKAGNGAARRMLVEAAWSYRFPARISREQLLRQEQLTASVRAIAWKAQERLCLQYRKLSRAGKPITTVTTAIDYLLEQATKSL